MTGWGLEDSVVLWRRLRDAPEMQMPPSHRRASLDMTPVRGH